MKDKFYEYYKQIEREGKDQLLKWLEKSDFFTAPASSRFHLSCEGGLMQHSVNVCEKLFALSKLQFGDGYQEKVSSESIVICGLLHDLCKVGYYEVDERNVKKNGEWVKEPYYKVNEQLPYGHGEKSVYIINGFIRLTRKEAMAINWHMGGFDARANTMGMQIGEAYKKFPLAVLLHLADMGATYLDENSALK